MAPSEKQIPGLDGLRALAVIMVLLFHQHVVEFGWAGVQLFFVLSGFLITGILARQRTLPLGLYLRRFYWRRFVRIFPLYYAYLLLLAALIAARVVPRDVAAHLPYAFTYTYDFVHAQGTLTPSKTLSHFWSLSVEEQFYLVWPFVIFFSSTARLKRLLWIVVAAGPLVRLVTWLMVVRLRPGVADPGGVVDGLPLSHVDAFAIGALASLFPPRRVLGPLLAVLGLCAVAGLANLRLHPSLVFSSLGYPMGMESSYQFVWGFTLINVAAALTVAAVARRQLFPWLFEWSLLARLGKISYGFYLFHYPVQWALEQANVTSSRGVRIGLQFALTCLVAGASYRYLERRFLMWKDRFPSAALSRTAQ